MCNLYTYKMTAEEMRALQQHFRLIGTSLIDVLRGQNGPALVYQNYQAPIVFHRGGQHVVERLRWGLPPPIFPPKPGEKPKPGRPVTNVRNTASRHWQPWLAAREVVPGKETNKGGRCIVPAMYFAEPDRNTSNPVRNRWFGRADGLPFFFAGIWREWQGDRGTRKEPNIGLHRLFAFLTTEPNGIVGPIHGKAMPVMLMTAADVEQWLRGTVEAALMLQRPAAEQDVVIVDEKKAG